MTKSNKHILNKVVSFKKCGKHQLTDKRLKFNTLMHILLMVFSHQMVYNDACILSNQKNIYGEMAARINRIFHHKMTSLDRKLYYKIRKIQLLFNHCGSDIILQYDSFVKIFKDHNFYDPYFNVSRLYGIYKQYCKVISRKIF